MITSCWTHACTTTHFAASHTRTHAHTHAHTCTRTHARYTFSSLSSIWHHPPRTTDRSLGQKQRDPGLGKACSSGLRSETEGVKFKSHASSADGADVMEKYGCGRGVSGLAFAFCWGSWRCPAVFQTVSVCAWRVARRGVVRRTRGHLPNWPRGLRGGRCRAGPPGAEDHVATFWTPQGRCRVGVGGMSQELPGATAFESRRRQSHCRAVRLPRRDPPGPDGKCGYWELLEAHLSLGPVVDATRCSTPWGHRRTRQQKPRREARPRCMRNPGRNSLKHTHESSASRISRVGPGARGPHS